MTNRNNFGERLAAIKSRTKMPNTVQIGMLSIVILFFVLTAMSITLVMWALFIKFMMSVSLASLLSITKLMTILMLVSSACYVVINWLFFRRIK